MKRADRQQIKAEVEVAWMSGKDNEYLIQHPFNPRTERSEDARFIVSRLWTIFVLLPIAIGIVLEMVK